MKFAFETLTFHRDPKGVRGDILKQFSFILPKEGLEAIGAYRVDGGALIFSNVSDKKAERKFNALFHNCMTRLTNRLNGKPAFYIHKHSGIPLIGHSAFGIVDRNSNIVEIKPVTSCNISCFFCSVTDEKRSVDFVVEMEYLVEEFKKLVMFKECDDIEIFLNAHGEPTLYADLPVLVKNLSAIPEVKRISMITNGTLLTPEKLDSLIAKGLTQINLSMNSLNKKVAQEIMGNNYMVTPVITLVKHAATVIPLVIAPVWVPGKNDKDIEDIIVLAKSLRDKKFPPQVCIQNFLEYKFGVNPVKQKSWDQFYEDLKILEKKYGLPLTITKYSFNVRETKKLPKPFKKGQIIVAELKCPGRLPHERIAVSQDRIVSVMNCHKEKGTVKVKLTKSKHNLFVGTQV